MSVTMVPVSVLASIEAKFPTASMAPVRVSTLIFERSGSVRIRSTRFRISDGTTVMTVRPSSNIVVLISLSATPFGDVAVSLDTAG